MSNEKQKKPKSEPPKSEKPNEPSYVSAIDDLKKWSEQQEHPILIKGALNYLGLRLEERRAEERKKR